MATSANTSATVNINTPPITHAINEAGPADCAAYIAENNHPEPITLPSPVANNDQKPSVLRNFASSFSVGSRATVMISAWAQPTDLADGAATNHMIGPAMCC